MLPTIVSARPEGPRPARGRPAPEDVVRLLEAVRKGFHLAYERHRLHDAGLDGLSSMRLLAAVATHPGVTVSGLARLTGVPKSQVSVLMVRAERAGWVLREADPGDRRLVCLCVTVAGRARLSRWRAARHRALIGALRDLSAEQLAAVVTALEILLGVLDPGGRQGSSPPRPDTAPPLPSHHASAC